MEKFRHFLFRKKKKVAFYIQCITPVNFQTFYFWKLKVPSSISKLEKKKIQGAYYTDKTNCALTQPLTPKRKLLGTYMEKHKAFVPSSFITVIFLQIMLLLIMACLAHFLISMRNLSLIVIQVIFPK